ncbi:glycosyltransferase [Autumnicola edwardsiae]|uniref:Glycosyltransferase n=1 Tax=Autumnicola edwardsiae TaxID=3075594 RepID=A0ABU3CVM4_9FLAO|nr:glycosyltransferase [Zunongwangia sp. F297]MDT0650418.1 glycosyltransferase [Zunongwangia sp. F297]
MKILHVVEGMDPKLGGVCQAIRTIVRGLSDEGIANEVVTLDPPDANFLSFDHFPVHALGPKKTAWSYSRNYSPWLKKNLQKFDFVIIHGLWLYNSYATFKVWIELKNKCKSEESERSLPKLYVMPHGMLDPYFQEAAGRKLKAVRNSIYWKLIESKIINGADGLLFTCEEERRLSHKPFHPYQPKTEIILGMGTEAPPEYELALTRAFLQACEDLDGRPYFLFLSRIHEKKGVENLISAYEILLEKNSGNSIPALMIAGPGKETSYGRKLEERVKKSPLLMSSVFFPGMLTDKTKWGAFYGCEAFILPSEQENFGIAVVEALACAKAVLISDQINIWREIYEASAGLVAPKSVTGTLSLLQNWMSLSGEQKREMEENSLKCYRKFYAVDSFVQRWKQNLLMPTYTSTMGI